MSRHEADETRTRPADDVPAATRGHDRAPDSARYQILGEHGRGGIGRVSRAYDRDLGRDVAIKELIARNHVSEARFVREAMITARLEHPGIVPVHEAGRWHDGTPFYAMKLVAGRPLRDLIAERTTVDDRVALLHHVIAVADAMAYAHRRHIIHRDLKPGNVIVGEFGETVVIDWGLAKDLSTADPDPAVVSPSDDRPVITDLTTTGSVLGTPAYMAPEQARGEHVDQRVDVFAIGAMLWELCALQRVPPRNLRQRHALLRRNGIDRDLITILDKALAPDAADRYRDAGELAADLKAFKAGARIAARAYSLPALLGHWTRRHRALALSIAAALVVVAAGATLYLRNVTAARDHAAASQHAAADALDALTLKNAQLLLASDPSAALDVLAAYHGRDTSRVRQIAAEARGRGAPLLRATVKNSSIIWTQILPGASGQALGGVLSGSLTGTIALTTLDGATQVLARDVKIPTIALYYPDAVSLPRQLFAYPCDPDDVCVLDMAHRTVLPRVPALRGLQSWIVGFSPSGGLLAVISQAGRLTIFDVHDIANPVELRNQQLEPGDDIQFVDEATIAASSHDHLTLVPLARAATGPAPTRLTLPEPVLLSVDRAQHRIFVTSRSGSVFSIEGPPWHVKTRGELCHGRLSGIQAIPRRHDVAYACKEGALGFWDPDTGAVTPRFYFEGHSSLFKVSPHGDYVVMSGGVGRVYVLDLVTDVLTTYKGFDLQPSAVSLSVTDPPLIAVGNVRGEIRVWPLPSRIARTALTLDAPLVNATFLTGSPQLITLSGRDELDVLSPTEPPVIRRPHDHQLYVPAVSPDGKTFAAYGRYGLIELWSTPAMRLLRTISPQHGGLVSRLRFLPDSTGFVTAGNDDRLVRWQLAGDAEPIPSILATIDQPIENFVLLPATGAVVIESRAGDFWQASLSLSGEHRPTLIHHSRALALRQLNRMIASPDGFTAYAGLDTGDVLAIDTRDQRVSSVLHADGVIDEISITPDATTIAISTVNHALSIGTRATPSAAWTWHPVELPTLHHVLTPDGILIAIGRDGTIWLYDTKHDRWLCVPVGTLDLHRVVIDDAGDAAAALSVDGRLIWLDLGAARRQLASSS
ncbi:MAG TPA: WD40 repeat domain-containing serine/threonine protein kinase [Kofleriaceae bacterium]|nr:WD40 repeat domain-containing serine/threonine protein kinase [Kofleriaceae bacterium]